jgi:hypothetical protein
MTKPLPCPRCGADIESGKDSRSCLCVSMFRVKCKNGHAWDDWYYDKESAIKAWNERPKGEK